MDEAWEKERARVRHAARIRRLKHRLVTGAVVALLFSLLLSVIALLRIGSLARRLEETQSLLMQVSIQLSRTQTEELRLAPEPESTAGAALVSEAAEGAAVEVAQDVILSAPQTETLTRDPYEGMRRVCLTFDDGPSRYTDDILDILDSYGIKATFFVNGHEGYDEQYRRIVAEGHTIGMHSYSHNYAEVYADLDSFAEDLYRIQEYIEELTGETSTYYRFPGGSSNTVSRVEMTRLISYLNAKGIVYYDWNVASGDASGGYHSAESLANSVISQISALDTRTVVVLMHDAADKRTTVEALPIIIERIQNMDNTVILPITEDITPIQHVSLQDGE